MQLRSKMRETIYRLRLFHLLEGCNVDVAKANEAWASAGGGNRVDPRCVGWVLYEYNNCKVLVAPAS